jgi:Na+-translocating ferredoxin:NAD+ oxidoreductase RnfG subunit
MNVNKFNRIIKYLIVLLPIVFIINFTSCNVTVLESEPDILNALQKLYLDACYYNYDEESSVYGVYDSNKKKIGYAYYAEGQGYSSIIHILVGLKDTETIYGIVITSHEEDYADVFGSGPGKKLTAPEFIDQFNNIKIVDCMLNDDGGVIDAITQATVSSKAVAKIVRESALKKSQFIK